MDSKQQLTACRQEIDKIDEAMVALLGQRMEVATRVAHIKAENNMALTDRAREAQVIESAAARASQPDKAAAMTLMRTLISLSTTRQAQELRMPEPASFPPPVPRKTQNITVAFQGVSGAWGEEGASRLFPEAALTPQTYFDDVFEAVRAGQADYGVLPIENSLTGAIGEVYDLLRRNACYIIGEVWVPIEQCLLALPGTRIEDVREVYSHPQGFGQCRRFLKAKPWDLTECSNTAVAARMVHDRGEPRFAAIASRRAAAANGLAILAPGIMDNAGNRTRFIAIAAQPSYDSTSTVTSVTFSTGHRSGALCTVLEAFMLAGLNLTRIESRPVARDKYRFFADIEANILDEATRDGLSQAAAQCEYFEILGCYRPTGDA